MINTPSNNIILSIEEQNRVNFLENRLKNFQDEITIAKKQLEDTRIECDKVTKERIYQEELITKAEIKLYPLVTKVGELEKEIVDKTDELDHLLNEIHTKIVGQETKNTELKDREEKIESQERDLTSREKLITGKNNELINQIDTFDIKVTKLKEIIATF